MQKEPLNRCCSLTISDNLKKVIYGFNNILEEYINKNFEYSIPTAKVKRTGWQVFFWNFSARLILCFLLTLPTLCIPGSSIKIKIILIFYFHTSLWCLKSFYEGFQGIHKTFWGNTKNCEKKLTYFFPVFSGTR